MGVEGAWRSVEQPRCGNCWHRRIYHYLGVQQGGSRGPVVEMSRPCSLDRCGCLHYTPSNVRTISGG